MRRYYWLLGFLLPLFVSACTQTAVSTPVITEDRALLVFAGISLTEPFQELASAFKTASGGADIQFNFAIGQQHLQQLSGGAVADVLATANERQMLDAIESSYVNSRSNRAFARNRIILITPSDNPASVLTLEDLAKPGIKILVGSEETAIGQYTNIFLDNAEQDSTLGIGYRNALIANVISYETSVKAVLTKVMLGEADAGIVFTSDVMSEEGSQVLQIEIPDSLNVHADYYIAVTASSPHVELAQEFVNFVLSEAGQEILSHYGFISP